MHVVELIQADILVEVLKDTMVRLNLSLQNSRGQCYDGAANMAGSRNGVATQIASEEPELFLFIVIVLKSPSSEYLKQFLILTDCYIYVQCTTIYTI